MALDGYRKKDKALRRSFVLPPEIVEALNQIQQAHDYDNLSEALRFCVAFTYDQLSKNEPAEPDERLLTQVSKSYTLLQYLLLEVIKIHDGREELSEKGRQYLKKLNREIKSCLKQRGIDHERTPS